MQPSPGRFVDLLWFVPQPGVDFPAALRWPAGQTPGVAHCRYGNPSWPITNRSTRPIPGHAHGSGCCALIGEKITVKVTTQALLVGDPRRFRIDLPRLAGVLDRGGKVTVYAPPGQEFLVDRTGSRNRSPTRSSCRWSRSPARWN